MWSGSAGKLRAPSITACPTQKAPSRHRVSTPLRHLVLSGLGWAQLPDWLVQSDLAEGRLTRLAMVGDGGALEFCVAYLPGQEPGPAGRAFVDALCGDPPPSGAQRVA